MAVDDLSCTPLTCTVSEFCRSVKIGRTRFYAEVKAGRIEILKSGRKTLIRLSEREAYLNRLTRVRITLGQP